GPPRDQKSDPRAGTCEQKALYEALADDRAAARAERETDGHLFLPRRAAREEEVRHVRARDQQDQADHPHQHPNRRGKLGPEIRSSRLTGLEEEMLRNKALLEARREPLGQFHFLFVDLPI